MLVFDVSQTTNNMEGRGKAIESNDSFDSLQRSPEGPSGTMGVPRRILRPRTIQASRTPSHTGQTTAAQTANRLGNVNKAKAGTPSKKHEKQSLVPSAKQGATAEKEGKTLKRRRSSRGPMPEIKRTKIATGVEQCLQRDNSSEHLADIGGTFLQVFIQISKCTGITLNMETGLLEETATTLQDPHVQWSKSESAMYKGYQVLFSKPVNHHQRAPCVNVQEAGNADTRKLAEHLVDHALSEPKSDLFYLHFMQEDIVYVFCIKTKVFFPITKAGGYSVSTNVLWDNLVASFT